LLLAQAVLPDNGRWKVIVRFEGKPGWADLRLAPRRIRLRSE
jgi:hypothetical protein